MIKTIILFQLLVIQILNDNDNKIGYNKANIIIKNLSKSFFYIQQFFK